MMTSGIADERRTRRIRFMHVPKAGGTTLDAILARQYQPSQTFRFSGDFTADVERYRAMPPLARASLRLFTGHAALRTGIGEVDEAVTFTLLRDPVSRVRSFCQHAADGKSAYLLEGHPPGVFDLDRFLWSGDPHLSNQQTKMLINAGEIGDDSVIREIGADSARDLALRNLFERVDCFGLQEAFDASLLMLSQRYEWSIPWYFSKNRGRGKRVVFEPRHLERIRELNSIDVEVYESAREVFAERMKSASEASVRAFMVANTAAGPLMATWDDARLRALYWYRRATGTVA